MPRIRKKTSKRVTTHRRAKIKHKIAEGRKKKKKEAKKNTQWVSKKKKDPGIPNEFPYKDQILAEVAESRRQVEEAKRRRKEEQKALREGQLIDDGAHAEGVPVMESSSSKPHGGDDVPLLLSPDLPNLKAVLDKVDIVLHVLDARDPASFRLPHIEEAVAARESSKLVFVLNKIDLVPREALTAWVKHLRSQHPTFLFRTASAFLPKTPVNDPAKGKAKESSADAIGKEALLKYLRQCAEEKQGDTLQVGVIGLTNTGKSAIINSLARKAAIPIYAPTSSTETWSTTTSRAYEVTIEGPADKKIVLIDTPGVSLCHDTENTPSTAAATFRIRDVLLRSRGRVDKLKDPIPAVEHILSRANTTDVMVHYSLPAFAPGDTTAFLAGVARANALLRRGGVADAVQAARLVLRDWVMRRLPFYTEAEQDAEAAPEDVDVLAEVKTRKEMRRTGPGLVRLKPPGELETRRVDLEKKFVDDQSGSDDAEESTDEEGDEDEDGDEGGDAGDEGEDAEEGEDEDSEEEGDKDEENSDGSADEADLKTPLPRKRKRSSGTKTAPPAKKVAFAAGTLDSQERKRARKGKPFKDVAKSSKDNAKSRKDIAKSPKDAAKSPKGIVERPSKESVKKIPDTTAPAESAAYDFGQFFK